MLSTPLSPAVPSPPPGVPAPALYHLSGAPVRAASCERSLFTPASATGTRRPLAPVRQQLDRRLWGLPGVYCLLWDPLSTNPTGIYIGSANDLIERILTHHMKDWSHAILLTGHGMSRGGSAQMERGLGRVVKEPVYAKRLSPRWKLHPSPWGADMPWFLFEPLVVLLDLCLDKLGVTVKLDPKFGRL